MPGVYKFKRDKHHDVNIHGESCTSSSADVTSCYGKCTITSQASTDPEYQSELLQESEFQYVTRSLDVAEEAEQRVFRLQNGEWSYWSTNRHGTATKKITDLVLINDTGALRFRAKQQGFLDRSGVNKHLGFTFYVGDNPFWMMHHHVQWPDGHETMQGTTYSKKAEHRQQGWVEWLAEGVKIRFGGIWEYRAY